MFDLSFEKLFVLALVALFVLGPERLPTAATWLGRTIRQVKTYATGANEQLRRELGPELDQLREPLAQLRQPLQELRGPLEALRTVRDPRTAVSRYLLSDPMPLAGQSTSRDARAAKPLTTAQRSEPRRGITHIDSDAT